MNEATHRDENTGAAWPGNVDAITLFVEDLGAAKRFYGDVFRLPVHFEDDSSTVFEFGDTVVNLLQIPQPPSLSRLPPLRLPTPGSGSNSRSA